MTLPRSSSAVRSRSWSRIRCSTTPAPAISIDANSLKSAVVTDWGRETGLSDQFVEFADNHGPMIRQNLLDNNAIEGLVVRGAVLTTESIWDDTDIAHVLFGEIILLNYHTLSGLQLRSSEHASLVVKLGSPTAGFTANGQPLDIDDRIGGSLYVLGTAKYPVQFTSLKDDTVGAGVGLDGLPLTDTNNNGPSTGLPGDWRSIRLEQYSNDRNVELLREVEFIRTNGIDANGDPTTAQVLGVLAPDLKSGDSDRRLGFQVHGAIASDDPSDLDVYSFSAGVARKSGSTPISRVRRWIPSLNCFWLTGRCWRVPTTTGLSAVRPLRWSRTPGEDPTSIRSMNAIPECV